MTVTEQVRRDAQQWVEKRSKYQLALASRVSAHVIAGFVRGNQVKTNTLDRIAEVVGTTLKTQDQAV